MERTLGVAATIGRTVDRDPKRGNTFGKASVMEHNVIYALSWKHGWVNDELLERRRNDHDLPLVRKRSVVLSLREESACRLGNGDWCSNTSIKMSHTCGTLCQEWA